MDYEEYQKKKQEALSNFPKSFIETIRTDPHSSVVIHCLIRGGSPFEIMYDILMDNIQLRKRLSKFEMESNIQTLYKAKKESDE